MQTCIRSTLIGKRSDALLSCAPESGKFEIAYKTEYDGSRIYVGLSSHVLYAGSFRNLGAETWERRPTFRVEYRNISLG